MSAGHHDLSEICNSTTCRQLTTPTCVGYWWHLRRAVRSFQDVPGGPGPSGPSGPKPGGEHPGGEHRRRTSLKASIANRNLTRATVVSWTVFVVGRAATTVAQGLYSDRISRKPTSQHPHSREPGSCLAAPIT